MEMISYNYRFVLTSGGTEKSEIHSITVEKFMIIFQNTELNSNMKSKNHNWKYVIISI